MNRFLKDCKGAVTVFITFLLIPSVLVSGLGVDMARIYGVRSATHNADLMAANAVLTQYDKTLQDVYGLYAVAQDDETLLEMVDTYVKATLFGEEVTEAQLGTFSLLAGTETISHNIEGSMPLSNVDVLRQQIEEYSKYRVPVTMIQTLIALAGDDGEEIQNNNAVVESKLAADSAMQEIYQNYKDLYGAIEGTKTLYETAFSGAMSNINAELTKIHDQMNLLIATRTAYEAELEKENCNDNIVDDLERKFDDIVSNISALAQGGTYRTQWTDGYEDEDDPTIWIEGKWRASISIQGIESVITSETNAVEGTITTMWAELNTMAQKVNDQKSAAQTAIANTRATIASTDADQTMEDAMEEELKEYEKLLEYDFASLVSQMKTANETDYQENLDFLKNIQGYGLVESHTTLVDPKVSFTTLGTPTNLTGCAINFGIINPTVSFTTEDTIWNLKNEAISLYWYSIDPNFTEFKDCSTTHSESYSFLSDIDKLVVSEDETTDDDDLSDEQKESKSSLTGFYSDLKALWTGITNYTPPNDAATAFPDGVSSSTSSGMSFALPGLSASGGMADMASTLIDLVSGSTGIGTVLTKAATNAADQVLLVGYCDEMFSNWTYQHLEEEAVSLSNTNINVDNNYFMYSEAEYLVFGQSTASSNLKQVTLTLLALRFLVNYASSYIISEVNSEIQGMEAAVSAIPFAGAVLYFVVRPVYVLAESVVDVANLRNNNDVTLIKTKASEWSCSFTGGLVQMGTNAAKEAVSDDDTSSGDDGITLNYSQYLFIFMLLNNGDVMAKRAGDLIALNVNKINGDTDYSFRMSGVNTTFAVSTQIDMEFMFFSLPFANTYADSLANPTDGSESIILPTTFHVVDTAHRGY